MSIKQAKRKGKDMSKAELTAKHIETLERHDCVEDIGGVYALATKEQSVCATLHAWGFLELVRRDDKGPIYRTTDAGRAAMEIGQRSEKLVSFAVAWEYAIKGGKIQFWHWKDAKCFIAFDQAKDYFVLTDSRGVPWPWVPTVEQLHPGAHWYLVP